MLPLLLASSLDLTGWLGLYGLIIMVAVLFYTILYMIGKSLNSNWVVSLGKEGLADVINGVGTLVFVVFLIGLISVFSLSMIGIDLTESKNLEVIYMSGVTSSSSIQEVATAYLHLLYYLGEEFYRQLIIDSLWNGALTSLSMNVGGSTIKPFAGYSQFLSIIPSLSSTTMVFLITTTTQIYLFEFFKLTSLSFFVPLGIALRFLPPTKYVGNSLIALALTMNFMYPLLLNFNFLILANNTTIDPTVVSKYVYNLAECNGGDECASGVCEPVKVTVDGKVETKHFCKPCVLEGSVKDPTACCSISKYEDDSCVVSDLGDSDNIKKKGGLILSSSTPGLSISKMVFWTATVIIGASVIGKAGVGLSATMSGKLGKIGTAVGTALSKTTSFISKLGKSFGALIFIIGVTLDQMGLVGFVLNPLVMYLIVMLLNADFLFLGILLPVIEFIILIEFLRVVTGSLGSQIDLLQVYRVL